MKKRRKTSAEPPPSATRLLDDAPAFRHALSEWFRANARPLPWRETRDPYRVLLSEVILQQTRVEQGLPYYLRFVNRFPTVEALASADLNEVLKAWEGAGYYARARNLHRTAKVIVDRFHGRIPADMETLLGLPGLGPYTAAAVASIAFGKPHGVLDGNVMRVLTRLVRFEEPVNTTRSRKALQRVADALVDPKRPGDHNEAMMELGAIVCTHAGPSCLECPVRHHCCVAGPDAESYPRKRPAGRVPHYDIAVAVISNQKGELFIQQRPEEGLLGGLWEFPGGKRKEGESIEDACRREVREELGVDVEVGEPVATIRHAYSHFKITLHAFSCGRLPDSSTPTAIGPWKWIAADRLDDFAFPRANRKLIDLLASSPKDRKASNPDVPADRQHRHS